MSNRKKIPGRRAGFPSGTRFRFACVYTVLLAALLVFASCDQPNGGGTDADANTGTFYDPNLYSWRTASWSPFRTADTINGFAYGNGVYVAVSGTGRIAYSRDGDIWYSALPAGKYPFTFPDNALYAVAWGAEAGSTEGVFIAVGNNGTAALSSDGIHWEELEISLGASAFGTQPIRGIAWGVDRFVAVGGDGNVAVLDADGDTAAFGSWRPAWQINDVAYSDISHRFYIVGDNGIRGYSNNITAGPGPGAWRITVLETEPPFNGNNITRAACGRYCSGEGEKIGIAVTFNEWGHKTNAIATTDTFGGLDADIGNETLGDNRLNGVAYGESADGSRYFVVAGSAAMIGYFDTRYASFDSERYWRALSFTEFKWWEITALKSLNGRFFAGGIAGKIAYSGGYK